MKIIRYVLVLALSVHFAPTKAQIIDLPPFDKILIDDNATVQLHMDTVQAVVLESGFFDPSDLKVKGKTLHIECMTCRVDIRMPQLKELSVRGVGKLVTTDTIRVPEMDIDISGSGKADMILDTDVLKVNISGSGKLTLSGYADDTRFSISGSGKIDGSGLKMEKASASISGTGKIYGDVKQELDLDIAGSGSFYYKEKPPIVDARITGVGKYGQGINGNMEDTVVMKIGKSKIVMVDDEKDSFVSFIFDRDSIKTDPPRSRSHWGGVDIGFNQLLVGDRFATTLPDEYDYLDLVSGKSVNVNLNLLYHDFELNKRFVMFTTGLGLSFNNFHFNSDRTIQSDTNRLVAAYDLNRTGQQINYRKNKLALTYVTVPLLLQFNSDPTLKKSFHVGTGLLLSYKINSHLKLVWNEDGDKQKDKRRDEFNLQPFRCDATIRLGYQYYTVYASYALNELFREGRGAPQLHPFQVGINLFGW